MGARAVVERGLSQDGPGEGGRAAAGGGASLPPPPSLLPPPPSLPPSWTLGSQEISLRTWGRAPHSPQVAEGLGGGKHSF